MTRSDRTIPRDRSAPIAALLLIGYGVFLYAAQQTLTFFDDEVTIVTKAATHDPAETLRMFWSGPGQHEHPPLYDLFLNGWIRATGGSKALLRVPSLIFFCGALWFVGAAAQRLWQRRLLAIAIGMAWPLGLFVGTPAHWSSLAMLFVAAMTWAYCRWRDEPDAGNLALLVCSSLLLFYTNYLGLAFLGALGIHFLFTRPTLGQWKHVGIAAVAFSLGALPLLSAFLFQLRHGPELVRSPLQVLADIGYHGFALLASEAVAPWTWPAALVVLAGLALAHAALRGPRALWPLGLLPLVFLASGLIGIIGAKRLGLFGPWLILGLTGLVPASGSRLRVLVPISIVFGLGWIGAIHQQWYGTLRHIEPWEEVVAVTLERTRPGDLVVCDHQSFYFYAHYALGWRDWISGIPRSETRRSERDFASLDGWEAAIAGHDRVLYVRSVVDWRRRATRDALESYLAENFRLVWRERYLRDKAADLKSRFVEGQPSWRIELLELERVDRAESPHLSGTVIR